MQETGTETGEESLSSDNLTPKQQRFVVEYLIDLNGKRAYKTVYGGADNVAASAGSRLLKNVKVSAAIAQAQRAHEQALEITQDYVLRNVKEILERCMQRAPVMVRDGKALKQATDADGQHIWQFDAKGAIGAVTLLGKHKGMFTDRVAVTVTPGTGVLAVPVTDAASWASQAITQQSELASRIPIIDPATAS